eukprot:TRINITY_DN6676_c0_g1_i7.p1 TRINITY_DN6676_c0_g1~~TRINITY_DN6676_c0_g1_i7.p1  ORF type:complete len:249 (+),score=25.80 TRINITY_DN6676_c0_g1_i7:265-1011(+)
MLDEPWLLAKQIAPLLGATPGLQLNWDFMAWYIDPSNMERGWAPHRDRVTMDFGKDGLPKYSTFWIALTDATPINSCITVLPAHFDDEYHSSESTTLDSEVPEIQQQQLQDGRCLPAQQGEVLCWGGRTLHWGGRASPRTETPRISIAIAASHPDFEDPKMRISDCLLAADGSGMRMPSMEERMKVISLQLWSYDGPYEVCIQIPFHVRKILSQFEKLHDEMHAENESTDLGREANDVGKATHDPLTH